MERLFSYGTLQTKPVQLSTFGRELEGSVDSIVGYQLSQVTISDQSVLQASGVSEHPILQYTGKSSDVIEGTVYLISEAELEKADEYEVDDYKRVLASCASGEKAWVYVAAY